MRSFLIVAAIWTCATPAFADPARIRTHAEAFVVAFNDGSRQAADRFIADHGVGDPARLHEIFTRHRASGGLLERAQVRVLPSGTAAHLYARRSRTGVWENFQFRADASNEDRVQLVFVAQALEPYAIPDFSVTDARFSGWMDGFAASLRQTQPFYGVIAVAQGDRVLYQRAFGLADVSTARPNALTTRFGMASGSKMFTAVAIMQLAERGVLSLDDPLPRFVPEAADLPHARAITIRHLLSHTSGIGNYWDSTYEADWANITQHVNMLPHVLRNFGTPEIGPYAYSNSNFALLGLIVERASGQNFYDYMNERVFTPAGMRSAGYPIRSPDDTSRAMTYDPVMEAGLVAIGRHELVELGRRGSGAGGASAAIADLLAFDRALRNNTLISADSFAQMRTLQAPSEVAGNGYGYGMLVRDGVSWGHEGSAPGTQFAFRHYAEGDVTIIVMSNFNTIAGPEIADALDRILTDRD